ncbi:hypothetical protein B0H16DRAFT_543985 [Mycena metata]|uniref:Uncharacterized protein n=1 Tax=Mycena metata TaxID=1033252 RepID=A0AAD7ME72_9AGAR|nr:hypothetical protein B0H16DRAFT_543985 [Mycena metata]
MAAYLRNRGLLIECLCAFTSVGNHNPRSCQIMISPVTGDVLAFCHFDSDRCGFKLNLSDIHKKSLLTSTYPFLPTLATNRAPDMDVLHVAFMLKEFPAQDAAPYFEGYLGEHISTFPAGTGTRQLTSQLLVRRRRRSNRNALDYTPYARDQRAAPASNHRYREIDDDIVHAQQVQTALSRVPAANTVAGPSRLALGSVSCALRRRSEGTGGKEARFLRKLGEDQGISEDFFDTLVERCGKCKCLYAASKIKAHSKGCLGVVDIL